MAEMLASGRRARWLRTAARSRVWRWWYYHRQVTWFELWLYDRRVRREESL